jgi:hypothetical protein
MDEKLTLAGGSQRREDFARASAQAKVVVTAVAGHLGRHLPEGSVARIRDLAAER